MVALGLGGTALVVVMAVGPLTRHLARAAAARRGLDLDITSAWPAWGGVRLSGIVARPVGWRGVEARVDEVRLWIGPTFHLARIRVRGAAVSAVGTPQELDEQLEAWHARRGGTREGHGGDVSVEFDATSVRWLDGVALEPRLEARDIAGHRGADGLTIAAASAAARVGKVAVTLGNASAQLGPTGVLTRGHADSMLVDWDLRRLPEAGPQTSGRAATALADVDAATPLLEMPNLHAARAFVDAVTAALSRRIPPDVRLGVDAVMWKITPRDTSPLTVGPGPLSLVHSRPGLAVDFAAGASPGGTSLTVRANLPDGPSDSTLEVQGGPVSLAVLGLQDGPTGLFDVAHTTVSGRARFALAADAGGLDFDCTWSARGLSVRDARLASDAVRGLDAELRARGALAMPGNLRFDDLAVTVGALHVETSGVLQQEPDHVAAAIRFSIPTAPCQTLLNSIPTALLPVVEGMTFAGTFGAEGHVVFDSRSPDDLELDYDVRDRCTVASVPPYLARDALAKPFMHRIYLPDGSVHDEETGPGTSSWTPLDQISSFMEVAVTTTEDGAFRHHHGYNQSAIRASLIANLKTRRFVRGASTITMQLAKNLFLTREKTLSRKLDEVILTDYLEQEFSKDEILELYLNVVEFGPAIYGVTAAADYYFGRSPAELNLAEAFFLASLLPAPLHYGAVRDAGEVPDARMRSLRALMRIAQKRGLISDEELSDGLRQSIEFWRGGDHPPARSEVSGRRRLDAPPTGPAAEPERDDTDSSP